MKKMFLDIFFQQFSVAVSAVILLVFHFFIGRFGGTQVYGEFSFIMAVLSFYAILMDGGFKTLIFRESVGGSVKQLKRNAFSYSFLTASAGIAIFTFIFGSFGLSLVSVLFFFLFVFINMIFAEIKGKGNFRLEGFLNVCLRLLQLVSVVLIIKFISPFSIFTAMSLSFVIFILFIYKRVGLKEWLGGFNIDFGILKLAFPFIVIDFLTSIYFRIDIIIINYLLDKNSVALYSSAYKFVEGLILIFTPVTLVIFRKFREKHLGGERQKSLIFATLGLSFVFSVICILFFMKFGDNIMLLTFGKEYVSAVPVLLVLGFSLIFVFPNGFLTQFAIAANRERYYALTVTAVTFVNILLNIILIPSLGINGAAYATIASEMILFLFLFTKTLQRI